jgi:hypothetical protein
VSSCWRVASLAPPRGRLLRQHAPAPRAPLPGPRRRYNALFQLLLRLKRVQLHLEQAWQDIGRIAGRGGGVGVGGGGEGGGGLVPLLRLRQHMAHLVTNLQIYLQARRGGGSAKAPPAARARDGAAAKLGPSQRAARQRALATCRRKGAAARASGPLSHDATPTSPMPYP